MDIEKTINEGIRQYDVERTASNLGDRTQYVGASDITGCMRKAVLTKREPVTHSLATLVRFLRGHMAEKIVKHSLDAMGIEYDYQPEFIYSDRYHIRAHPDFVLPGDAKDILVLECKSVNGMVAKPYEDWARQLQYQMGLIASHTDKNVKGAVVAIDIGTGQVKVFNGYSYDREVFARLTQKADTIWNHLNLDTESNKIRTEFGPLCAWCQYRHDCTEFIPAKGLPEVPLQNEVQEYLLNRTAKKEATKTMKRLAATFKHTISSLNLDDNTSKAFKVGEFTIRETNRRISGLDVEKIKAELPEVWEEYKTEGVSSYINVR